ncbi:hypothetical protein BH11GEM1_BH11GEM1_14520 [soil metagenome]
MTPTAGNAVSFPSVRAIAISLSVAIVGCGSFAPDTTGTVTAAATATGILVSNQTNVTVNTFTIAEDALPLWDPPQCLKGGTPIPAGETVTLVWSTIYQYGASKTRYRMMWWRDTACSFGTDSDLRGVVTIVR